MYNSAGGYGYPPNVGGGYPPQQAQQPYGAQPPPAIGFDNLAGGATNTVSGYGAPASVYPPAPAQYPPAPSQYPPAPSPYPTGGGMPPYEQQTSSFTGMAYAAAAAMSFRPPQQNYPPQPGYGGAPQHYGSMQQQPYGHASTQLHGGTQQQIYGGGQQPPYSGAPSQPSQPYGGSQQQAHGGASTYGGVQQQAHTTSQQSHPTEGSAMWHARQQLSNTHESSPTSKQTPPSRPAPPTSKQTGLRGQIPMESTTQGTMRDTCGFNAQRDCEILRKAMKGLGTDEKAITSVLGARSSNQRQKIKIEFATMFGKDLVKELKSELSGNYETTVVELLMESADYDAYHCYHAIEGLGTDEKCLIEILCSRNNTDIQNLCASYRKLYGKELEKDIQQDTSGNFGRLLISLVQGGRLENEPLDHHKAAQDARALYEAGEARWGTDESRFNVILASRSFPQLRLIFDEYEKISKRTLEKAIKSEMSGDLKDGMVSVVKCARNRPAFFAEKLYLSMKGLGTDDKTLVRIMVSRCEIDMVQIKQEFQKAYSKTLESFIKDDCSGDYKKILLHLCNGN